MNISLRVANRIKKYDPSGMLDQTARVVLTLLSINHELVKEHAERVALICEAVAIKMKLDAKAAFFAGLLHDIGKLILPYPLFDGHDISRDPNGREQYAEIQTHARAGFKALENLHLFTALCAGLHHAVKKRGYGLTIDDLPRSFEMATVIKVLNISTIAAIADSVDAATHRSTTRMDGRQDSLRDVLVSEYPNDVQLIDIILAINDEFEKQGDW